MSYAPALPPTLEDENGDRLRFPAAEDGAVTNRQRHIYPGFRLGYQNQQGHAQRQSLQDPRVSVAGG
jgi:hypothetical protein